MLMSRPQSKMHLRSTLEPYLRNMIAFMTVSPSKSYQVFQASMNVWPLATLIMLTLLALQPVPMFDTLHPLLESFSLVEVLRNRTHGYFLSGPKSKTRSSGLTIWSEPVRNLYLLDDSSWCPDKANDCELFENSIDLTRTCNDDTKNQITARLCSEEPLCHVGCGDIDECGAGGGLNDCQNIATAGGFADSFTCSNTIGFVLKIHVIDQVF